MNALSLPFLRPFAPWAPLVLRIGLGIIMASHGWQKFSNIAGTTEFFGGLGVPAPGLMAWVVTIVELVGGLCIAFGLATRLWALLFVIVMLVAIALARFETGAVSEYELELSLLVGALSLALGGPGGPSLDRSLGIDRS